MPGFAQPNVLLVAAPSPPEREWLAGCARVLRGRYERVVEPCAGAFAIPGVFLRERWRVDQLECSDVSLFTSVLGYVAAGRPLAQLEVRVDGILLELPDDPVQAATEIIFQQLVLRLHQRSDEDYWNGIRRDLHERADAHRASIGRETDRLVKRLDGLDYRALDMWDHIAGVADDPQTIISLSPPTYAAGYEKFFDTGGRLTWAEPRYGVFDPGEHFARLHVESLDWRALLLCIEGTDRDESAGPPLYARRARRDWSWYGWTNRPEELTELGLAAVPRELPSADPLPGASILPPDHPITAESGIEVREIPAGSSRYYKDLWMHAIDGAGQAAGHFGVFIDGYIVGIGGITMPMPHLARATGADLIQYVYGCAAPHSERLGRLVTACALTRRVLTLTLTSWHAAQATAVVTAVLTRHPEAKFLRGLMKLDSRKKDRVYGNRLIYRASVDERSVGDVFVAWLRKEEQWRKSRSTSVTA